MITQKAWRRIGGRLLTFHWVKGYYAAVSFHNSYIQGRILDGWATRVHERVWQREDLCRGDSHHKRRTIHAFFKGWFTKCILLPYAKKVALRRKRRALKSSVVWWREYYHRVKTRREAIESLSVRVGNTVVTLGTKRVRHKTIHELKLQRLEQLRTRAVTNIQRHLRGYLHRAKFWREEMNTLETFPGPVVEFTADLRLDGKSYNCEIQAFSLSTRWKSIMDRPILVFKSESPRAYLSLSYASLIAFLRELNKTQQFKPLTLPQVFDLLQEAGVLEYMGEDEFVKQIGLDPPKEEQVLAETYKKLHADDHSYTTQSHVQSLPRAGSSSVSNPQDEPPSLYVDYLSSVTAAEEKVLGVERLYSSLTFYMGRERSLYDLMVVPRLMHEELKSMEVLVEWVLEEAVKYLESELKTVHGADVSIESSYDWILQEISNCCFFQDEMHGRKHAYIGTKGRQRIYTYERALRFRKSSLHKLLFLTRWCYQRIWATKKRIKEEMKLMCRWCMITCMHTYMDRYLRT